MPPKPAEPEASTFVPTPGAVVGPYTLEERLGRGSMGEVWRARGEGEAVALKIPLRPAFLRHLRREGLFLANVEHPNVARFLGADLRSDPPWLATELVVGQPLRALCRGTLTPQAATLICDQILAGLQAIHDAGILHLDLKPENVIVPENAGDLVKIVDLGLGRATTKLMEEVYLSVSLASRVPQVAGTLAYMSPEQRKGKDVDRRADLFAFGIMLHELLVGALPRPGHAITDARPELAPRWDVVVGRLTHPIKARRPFSAKEARHLVAYTLTDKLTYHAPEGGLEPRDLLCLDEEAFAAASPYVAGMVIGDGYELEALLGRGGFGEVWRARRGEGRFAIKLALSGQAAACVGLRREVEVAKRVDHPNVPKVLQDVTDAPVPHVVFELVCGKSLRLTIHEEEELPLRAALSVFDGMLDVVMACARADVVHMDLKPEHFLVDWDAPVPRVSLIDFGLAALSPSPAVQGSLSSRANVRGTLDYMAPEQREGKIGPAVDVYALGLCLFELLTFNLPKGPQSLATLRREVPHEIDRLALRMLSSAPQGRPSLAEARVIVQKTQGALERRRKRAGPKAVYSSLLGELKRFVRSLPPGIKLAVAFVTALALVVGGGYWPELLRRYRERAFPPPVVRGFGDTNFAPTKDTIVELGEAPWRAGKVLILACPWSKEYAGSQSRPARIDPSWSSLPSSARAHDPSEALTLITIFEAGALHILSVYDMRPDKRRLVARYELDAWPEFQFGRHGRIDIQRFVDLMAQLR